MTSGPVSVHEGDAPRGAVVLCGGQSSRMGYPKPLLPFGPELMLLRVVRLLREVVPTVVVAAAPDQPLAELPAGVSVVRDEHGGRGPLEGLYAGLRGLPSHIESAYVTGCDVPLLAPAFVGRMFELLEENSIAVPVSGDLFFPLAAVYRRNVAGTIEALLAANRLRPALLFDMLPTRRVPTEELAEVDPELASLVNLNRPEEYLDALRRAEFSPPPEILARLSPGSM